MLRRYDLLIYLAMIQSILQYGMPSWDGLGIIANNKLLTAQKKYNQYN